MNTNYSRRILTFRMTWKKSDFFYWLSIIHVYMYTTHYMYTTCIHDCTLQCIHDCTLHVYMYTCTLHTTCTVY